LVGFLFIPSGLLEPVSCRNIKWRAVKTIRINGRIKWNVKNRVKVALPTANPPQIH
jgi:hypothetical protein